MGSDELVTRSVQASDLIRRGTRMHAADADATCSILLGYLSVHAPGALGAALDFAEREWDAEVTGWADRRARWSAADGAGA